jgi:hypothetical protein
MVLASGDGESGRGQDEQRNGFRRAAKGRLDVWKQTRPQK